MVLIHDRILKIDIYNFEMSQITPEKSLKSNQIYSAPYPPAPTFRQKNYCVKNVSKNTENQVICNFREAFYDQTKLAREVPSPPPI